MQGPCALVSSSALPRCGSLTARYDGSGPCVARTDDSVWCTLSRDRALCCASQLKPSGQLSWQSCEDGGPAGDPHSVVHSEVHSRWSASAWYRCIRHLPSHYPTTCQLGIEGLIQLPYCLKRPFVSTLNEVDCSCAVSNMQIGASGPVAAIVAIQDDDRPHGRGGGTSTGAAGTHCQQLSSQLSSQRAVSRLEGAGSTTALHAHS